MYCTNGSTCKHGCAIERRCEVEGFEAIWMSPVELVRLRNIEAAAQNLCKVKGRYHSEIAMRKLIEACGLMGPNV